MYMINKDLYEDLQLTIYKNYSNICFDVSGGADSAILLYFLVNYLDEYNNTANIHLVTCAKRPTGYSNAMQSVKVVNRIIELTSTKLIKSHYTFYSDTQHREDFVNLEEDWFDRGKIDISITGTTQNPPYNIPDEPVIDRAIYRDKGNFNKTIHYSKNNRPVHAPFLKRDKKFIAKLYKDNNLHEILLPYTRSCESHNKDETNNFTSHCGKCWWCWERNWAFESEGIVAI